MSGSLNNVVYNVFRSDAFSGLTLTGQVNKYPYIPSFLGQLDLFEDRPLYTTSFQLNERDGALTLIPTTPRGSSPVHRQNDYRKARYFSVPRISFDDTIQSEEIQNMISEFGSDQIFATMQEEVARRTTGPTGLTSSMEYTWEYHRLGAIQGILYDAPPVGGGPAPVLENWFTAFGITPNPEVVFDLAAELPNTIRPICNQIIRTMRVAAKGAWIDGVTEVHALCGHGFFDLFTNHVDVTKTYLNWTAATELRKDATYTGYNFNGINWHDYRGSDDGTSIAVPNNKAWLFLRKSPGTFLRAFAPGEGFPNVNKKGLPMYVFRSLDMTEKQAWVNYELQSNPLHVCTRPETLVTGTADSTAD